MQRRHAAGRAALVALATLPMLLALTACSSDDGATLATDDPGLELFRKVKCSTCHGADAEGLARVGPALHGIAANWNQAELELYLQDPAPFRTSKPHLEELSQGYFAHMRAFPELLPEQRTQLALWLLER